MHTVSVTCSCNASASTVFQGIQRGRLFELTGADAVAQDFRIGGAFTVQFEGRGTIRGQFLDIVPAREVTMRWAVEGFWPLPEMDTRVHIVLLEHRGLCEIRLTHSAIPTEVSAQAKERAWNEILTAFKREVAN